MANINPGSENDLQTPTIIKRTFRWGVRGSKAETRLKFSTDHSIVYQREERLVRQIIHLSVDGLQIFETTVPSITIRPYKIEHSFQIEGVDCRFVIKSYLLGTWVDVRTYVGEVKVMHV